ncbi:MAG TPA: ATP-binding protein [Terracidiphilus sp.]|jgi:two-component system sensor histidine kinase CpxA
MPRLFVKIFLWFWATVILTGISLVLAFMLQPQSVPSRWRASLTDTLRYFGTAAVGAFEQGGVPTATGYIHRLSQDAHIHGCIFDAAANSLAGEHCSEFAGIAAQVAKGAPSAHEMGRGLARMAIPIRAPDGRIYIYASELLAGPRAAFGLDQKTVLMRACLAFIVSGLICYFLTLYLTRPILRLRYVAQQITAGQLSKRAEPKLESRQDEFGDLVRDFNRMAAKTEDLISSQRQLLNDVSHELRSPLARMNVALDLLRLRLGQNSALDHLESDLQRLNEMIGRLLTVAKLDAVSALQNFARVNLSELVASIAGDAEFEARERGCRVEVARTEDLAVLGDSSLLRSAIENVLRNAVRFTAAGTAVEVLLRANTNANAHEAIIVIRDYGAGVPEDELTRIFKPFYRLPDSRGLESTGAGLGLAIAERIVRLHGGVIRAMNAENGGLSVEMIFKMFGNTA